MKSKAQRNRERLEYFMRKKGERLKMIESEREVMARECYGFGKVPPTCIANVPPASTEKGGAA